MRKWSLCGNLMAHLLRSILLLRRTLHRPVTTVVAFVAHIQCMALQIREDLLGPFDYSNRKARHTGYLDAGTVVFPSTHQLPKENHFPLMFLHLSTEVFSPIIPVFSVI